MTQARKQSDLLASLRVWRDEEARIEGVEPYRVLPNATLDALVETLPQTKEELVAVKGIKEAKYRKYGKTLLVFFKGEEANVSDIAEASGQISNKPLSVGEFLESINVELSGLAARIQGEVTSVDIRERVVYFTLKDAREEAILNCVIFRYQYSVSGVEIAIGDEIIVEGVPEIYKPSGRFSLKVGVIELAGEGSLKKAYEALKAKLEKEGVFAEGRKRPLPLLVERVALITSSDGAALGDFTTNIGRNSMRIDFYPTPVEGKKAVFEIIQALKFFRISRKQYDCLVLIRGGGSLESLQAFNSEALVREIVASPIPVLCGVGHEKDITLASLAADIMVSTPTAAARTLGTPWEEARISVTHTATLLVQAYEKILEEKRNLLSGSIQHLTQALSGILIAVQNLEQRFREKLEIFPYLLSRGADRLQEIEKRLLEAFQVSRENSGERLRQLEQSLRQYNPERLLALGYSLVRRGETVIRSATSLKPGDRLDIQFGDGRVESEVLRKM